MKLVVSENKKNEILVIEHLHVLERYAKTKSYQLARFGINISIQEIISIGYIGLHKAANIFDENKSADFSKFAWQHIDFAFKAHLREIDAVHHETRKHLNDVKKITDTLSQKLGREPTDYEVADALKMDIEQLWNYKKIELNITKYDKPLEEILEWMDGEDQEDEVEKKEEKKSRLGKDMNDCIKDSLSGDKRVIIESMYFENLNAEEIALKLWNKFTDKEKYFIYNTIKNGKKKLKDCMENKGWSITDV